MDAVSLLTADHNRVRGLFARFRDAEEADDTSTMVELASLIFEELETHTAIEEQIFYPAVHDTSDDIAEVVDEGVEEHHVAKVLMAELAEVEPGSDQWKAKMSVLMENVEHHAEEEEQEMFPPLRNDLDHDLLEGLAAQLEAGKVDLGAPVTADKAELTKAELADLAREQEIPGRSQMGKEELAATVAPAGAATVEAEDG
jgi:hemerythrin superfamily protein